MSLLSSASGMSTASADTAAGSRTSSREFVAFVAAVMAVNALGVDLMLPALPEIGRELAVATATLSRLQETLPEDRRIPLSLATLESRRAEESTTTSHPPG